VTQQQFSDSTVHEEANYQCWSNQKVEPSMEKYRDAKTTTLEEEMKQGQ
jgi:hypothetical protein